MLGTPVESLYHSGKLQSSKWPMIHLSDVLRYVTLWKYGGIYMDLDVLITRNLEDIGPNFTGLQDEDTVAAGVIGFTSNGHGHEWINKLLTELNEHYSPDQWSYNALGVLHNLLTYICDTEQVANMTTEQCHGYQVQPIDVFYPVPYYQWRKYFDGNYCDEVLQHVYGNLTRAIHVWNKLSAKERPAHNSAYSVLAAKHCPKVFQLAADNF
ncbi:alpha14-galactosyltransferase 2 [Carabus blaptoides fortunei]